MVYPRENGLLTLSKFIAVCALASSFQTVSAADATPTPTSAVVCTASDGDVVVGVQAIPDSSCAAGGLGCYSGTCRFCKYSETSKSAHLLACSAFGYNFPTLAPEPATSPAAASAGDCGISDGDRAVGIRAITDASCVIGGLGCYSDHCRFCKEVVTPQSAHLADCSSFAAATTAPATTAPVTSAPVTSAPATASSEAPAVGTPAPTVEAVAPVGETVAPVVDTTAPAVVDTVAPVVETVAPVVDTVAPVVDTVTPVADTVGPGTVVPYTETPAGTTATPTTEEPGFGHADYVATECTIDESFKVLGIDVVADATVASLDADYYMDGCRFCKTVDSIEYESFSFCALFPGYYTATTTAPDTVAPEVNTTAPVIVIDTVAPVVDTIAPVVVVDTTAPVIAVDTVAPVVDTIAPVVVVDTTAPVIAVDTVAPVVDTIAPVVVVDTTAPVIAVDTVAPVVDTIAPVVVVDTVAPVVDTTAPAVDTPATDATVAAEPVCTTPVSEGDAAVGIQIITDVTCANGGLGCINSVCRFCKATTTPQSAHLNNCSELLNPTSSAPATECTTPVSESDAAAGIQVITDATCVVGGLGCFSQVCRFCKVTTTPQSAHLDDCTKYTTPTTVPNNTDPVFTPLSVIAAKCSIDDSFKSLGVDVAIDATVTATDIDYYTDGCRFCKTFDSAESSTFVACSSVAGYSSTEDTSAPVDVTTSNVSTAGSLAATCDMVVNPGDSAIGLTIVTDVSCLTAGGLGCIGETACKLCKLFETEQSATYTYCAGYPVATAAATSGSATAVAAVVVETPTVAPEVPAVNVAIACAGNELSTGDAEGGVAYTYDPTHCPAGTTAGCLGQAGCKFCKQFDSAVSAHLDYCPGYPVAAATAAPALRVQASADEVQAGQTKLSAGLNKLFNNNAAAMYAVAAAACVGVIAVIVAVAVGTKRVVRRLHRSSSASEDEGDEDEGSMLSAVTEDAATVTAEEADASLSGEV